MMKGQVKYPHTQSGSVVRYKGVVYEVRSLRTKDGGFLHIGGKSLLAALKEGAGDDEETGRVRHGIFHFVPDTVLDELWDDELRELVVKAKPGYEDYIAG